MRHRRVQGFTCHFALWLSIVLRLCDVACNGSFGVHDAYISRNTNKIGIVHAGSGFLRMRFFIIFEQMFFWCFLTKGCWSQTRVHPKWTNRVLVANNRRDRPEDAEFIVIARVFMYLFNCRVFGRTEAAIITQALLEKTCADHGWNATFGKWAFNQAPARALEQLSDIACRARDFSYMCRLFLHVGVTPVCNNQVCERHVGCTRLIQRRMEMQVSLGFYSKNWQGSQQLGRRHPAAEHGGGCAKCNPMKRCERIYCAKSSAMCTKTKANAEALLRWSQALGAWMFPPGRPH